MLLKFFLIFFLALKVCLLLYFFSCGFWFDRILISEALFSTFPQISSQAFYAAVHPFVDFE